VQTVRTAAFFDLDKTLITENGARLWMQRERKLGRLGLGKVTQGLFFLLLYHFGIVDIEKAMRKAISTIKGMTLEEIRKETHDWYQEYMAPHAASGAMPAVEFHKQQGHMTVLLTSSSPYASECAVQQFGLDHAICSAYDVKNNRLTGDFLPPLCYGEGKITHACKFAEQHNVDLAQSYFYTDSISDLPMLEAVGYPQIVQPDPRLRREAKRRNWPILDWS
jgi:HAD superfamily hydrolase (TIGR01490 family)